MPEIDGVFVFELPHRQIDNRGEFTKILSSSITPKLSIEEVFLSTTKKGFIRGMHFQCGRFQNNRIVSCIDGKVFDVLLDLRPRSNTFQNIFSVEFNWISPQAVYIPAGVAHGFQALEDNSQMIYFSDKTYNSKYDIGVSPINCGINWPIEVQGLSERDISLPTLNDYISRI